MNKTLSIKILNLLVLFSMLVFLIFSMKYSIIVNDDMCDYILNWKSVYHGRFFTYLIQVFFINLLPKMFNIHIQDFAIISQAFLKSIVIVFFINIMSLSFFQFCKKNILLPVINVFIFFLFFSFILKLKFIFGIEISAFFYGYIFPIPFFVLFWNLVAKIYIENQKILKKDYLIFSFLSFFLLTSNEEYLFVTIVMLFFLLLSKRFSKKIITLVLLLLSVLLLVFAFGFYKGFSEIIDAYNLSLFFNSSYGEITKFAYVFFNKLIYTVVFLWIPVFIGCVILYFDKNNRIVNFKILKYILISLLAFLCFFIGLYLLGPSFTYENYQEYYLFPRYWILHPGLLLCFYSFLIMVNLFLSGYLLSKQMFKYFVLTISIFFIGTFSFIIRYFEPINLCNISNRQTLYLMEKLSIFYLKQGKTPILPAENSHTILPTYNNSMPKDLEDSTGLLYKNKVYKGYQFLKYINIVYDVDVSNGMMFVRDEKEAIKFYKENGGILSDKEFLSLRFGDIKKNMN